MLEFTRSRLTQEMEKALRGIMTVREFPKGSALYRHGFTAEGIHLVETGSVRVLLPTGNNENQLLEVVGIGGVLGLSESMSGDRYRVTAEADEQTTTAFVTRDHLVQLLDDHHEFCMQIVRLLSDDLHALYHKFRSVSAHPGRPRRRSLNEQMN